MTVCRKAVALGVMTAFSLMAQGTKKGDARQAPPPVTADKAGKKGAGKELPPQSERCQAKTQDGDQCKRKSAEGSRYCWQHDPSKKKKG